MIMHVVDIHRPEDISMNLLRGYIREVLEQKQEPVRVPMSMPIPTDLQDIIRSFKAANQELYIVGGAVRDTLLHKTPKDYDLATGAPPNVVIGILSQDPKNKVDLTGKAFGVVRVWTPSRNEYEIATFRRDIGSGRRPSAVEFTSIEDDVKRRDLTINALFYDTETGEVVDYVGGLEDIKSGTIRAVGQASHRFQEDRLRILRAARFAGKLGYDIDHETKAAISQDNNLSGVSPERIRDEIIKGITTAKNVNHFLQILEELNLYPQVFPELNVDSNTGSNTKEVVIQLALMLANNDPNHVASILKKMKYTNDEVSAINFLIKFASIDKATAPVMKKEFNRIRLHSDTLQEYARASGIQHNTVNMFLTFAEAPPATSAHDLMAQGIKGRDIGVAMQRAEEEAYAEMLGEIRRYIKNILASKK